jgi:hypothetical protein
MSALNDAAEAIAAQDGTRETAWRSAREDSDSLRASLSKQLDDTDFEAPPKRALSLKDDDGNDLDIRGMAERAYDEHFVNAAKQEKEANDYAAFKETAREARRDYGLSGAEAFNTLMAAQKALTDRPQEALQLLAERFLSPQHAQEVYAHGMKVTTEEVGDFFKKYNIDETGPLAERIAEAIGSGAVKKTADTEATLVRAYRHVMKENVRA